MYLILLLSQLKFLNFNENIGISEIKKKDDNNIRPSIKNQPALRLNIQCPAPVTKDDQKRAFAGVGKPINVFVCRLSTLNFANRQAENTAIRNAVYGNTSAIAPR